MQDIHGNPDTMDIEEAHKDFLYAFQKPTQIYRYMAKTHSRSFLYRSLSYMKHRMSRASKIKDAGSLKSIVERLEASSHRRDSSPPVKKARKDHSSSPIKIKLELCNETPRKEPTLHCTPGKESLSSAKKTPGNDEQSIKVIYRFIRFDELQWLSPPPSTDAMLTCHWCGLNCQVFQALIKHLKFCHGRFNFNHYETKSGARTEYRIDVIPNDNYDGSYSGNPHDLSYPTPGLAFSRNGPTRRTPVTSIIYCKKRRGECQDPDDDDDFYAEPLVIGHDRLYYHTNTCLPIRAQDMDIDSEEENDPEWMKVKTQLMIDEFSDVNEGEKEVMKMWNLHVMKHGFVGDCQMFEACKMFVEEHGLEIFDKNLCYNFILHLESFYDYNLIDAVQKREIVLLYHKVKNNRYGSAASSSVSAAHLAAGPVARTSLTTKKMTESNAKAAGGSSQSDSDDSRSSNLSSTDGER